MRGSLKNQFQRGPTQTLTISITVYDLRVQAKGFTEKVKTAKQRPQKDLLRAQ